MSWRVVAASEVGTSHTHTGTPCQDSCWAQVDSLATGQPLLSIFVADGAGSATHGGDGAELAIQVAADFLTQQLAQPEFGLTDELAVDCVEAVRARLYAQADQDRLKARDFACTFLGLLSVPNGTLVLQIGDGGIALDVGNGLEVPIIPMTGEYANMTHFVTDDDALKQLITKVYPAPVRRAALFSDGIQRLALNMADNTVHEPFFAPFFDVLAKVASGQEDQLLGALVRFLGSSAVNERTDDDKTLALALSVV